MIAPGAVGGDYRNLLTNQRQAKAQNRRDSMKIVNFFLRRLICVGLCLVLAVFSLFSPDAVIEGIKGAVQEVMP